MKIIAFLFFYLTVIAVRSNSLRHDLAGDQLYADSGHVTGGGELTSGGGRWRPTWCIARHRVAVLVPYRRRQRDLVALLKVLRQLLRRQLLDYTIFVIEQVRAHAHCTGIHSIDSWKQDASWKKLGEAKL